MRIAVLAIGSEVLDGRVIDTNSNYIAARLTDNALVLHHVVTCDDKIDDITGALEYLAERAEVIIISGGLGPTTDDLTREAVSAFCGKALIENRSSAERLKEAFARRKRTFDPSNLKQALFPEGASVLPNTAGAAEGFHIAFQHRDKSIEIFSVPGVPKELKSMFEGSVLPTILKNSSPTNPPIRRIFRTFGLPESLVGSRVNAVVEDPRITISYRTFFPEIQVILKSSADYEKSLDDATKRAKSSVGEDSIFAESLEGDFAYSVHSLLILKNKTLSTGESCTGGLITKMLTAYSGSSKYLLGGAVVYSNVAKSKVLGVPPETIRTHGAVSKETALSLATGARTVFGSDIGISVTGIAGPDGGSDEKPVGTFFVGYASSEKTFASRFYFASERNFVQRFSACVALDIVRRELLSLSQSDYAGGRIDA